MTLDCIFSFTICLKFDPIFANSFLLLNVSYSAQLVCFFTMIYSFIKYSLNVYCVSGRVVHAQGASWKTGKKWCTFVVLAFQKDEADD